MLMLFGAAFPAIHGYLCSWRERRKILLQFLQGERAETADEGPELPDFVHPERNEGQHHRPGELLRRHAGLRAEHLQPGTGVRTGFD